MMSENYDCLKRAYHPNGTFYNAISMLCYHKVRANDICKIGRRYKAFKDSDMTFDGKKYIEWLKEGVKHDFYDVDNTEMYCKHRDSIGTGWRVMQKACKEIEEELLNKPKENKELFIKGILEDFTATYKLIEPIFTKPQYKVIKDIFTSEEDMEFELQSEEFVYEAFNTYQRFVNNLYIICLEHGYNLEYLQNKYNMPIAYDWNWNDTDYCISQSEFDELCANLKHPSTFNFRKENEDIFVCKRNDKELHRIHKELQERGYIKGSVYDFVAIMKGEECSAKLEWKLASTRRPKDPSPIALRDFLQLMGCDLKQAQIIANNYFDKSLPRGKYAESEHHKELYQIVNKM